jgi:hypothetical protein
VQPISTCHLEVLWHKRSEKTAIQRKLQVCENRLLSAFWAVNDPTMLKAHPSLETLLQPASSPTMTATQANPCTLLRVVWLSAVG